MFHEGQNYDFQLVATRLSNWFDWKTNFYTTKKKLKVQLGSKLFDGLSLSVDFSKRERTINNRHSIRRTKLCSKRWSIVLLHRTVLCCKPLSKVTALVTQQKCNYFSILSLLNTKISGWYLKTLIIKANYETLRQNNVETAKKSRLSLCRFSFS